MKTGRNLRSVSCEAMRTSRDTDFSQMSSKYSAKLANRCRLLRGLLPVDTANFMICINGYA